MKKVILFLAISLISVSAYSQRGRNTSDKDLVQKELSSSNIRGVDISHVVKVDIHNSNKGQVELTISKELEPYLIFSINGGIVKIGLDSKRLPREYSRNMDRFTFKADVYMNRLETIDCSGASTVTINDHFKVDNLVIDISGASEIKNMNVSGTRVEFDLSGATKVKGVCNVESLVYDLSGASEANMEIKANVCSADLSGASNITLEGSVEKMTLECSGASKAKLQGTVKRLSAEGSGACNISASGLTVVDLITDLSGASSMDANITGSLSVSLSGASSLTYTGDKIDIRTNSISRGSSLKKR